MFYRKLFIVIFLSVLSASFLAGLALAQEKVVLHFFYGSTCPHCQKAEVFLEKLKAKYPSLEIKSYEVFENAENTRLLEKFLKEAGQDAAELRVPAIFITRSDISGILPAIDPKVIIGYQGDETTGREIEGAIIDSRPPKTFKLPLIGEIDPQKVSLPFLAVFLGLIDGFNPCAMWVLLLLISLLLTVKSRKKMWLVGGTFIAASGILYFIFMTAWLNLFLFISYVSLTRLAIGVVAVLAGLWRIRDFLTWQPGVCKVTDEKSHGQIEEKIRKILAPAALPATFLGIVALAFSVNLVEFFCSAGFPAIFTQILAIQKIPALGRYAYLLVYDLFYMLDDLVVFSIAVLTLQKIGFTDKYSRWSCLIGGLLIFLLGVALVFKPELLMFG